MACPSSVRSHPPDESFPMNPADEEATTSEDRPGRLPVVAIVGRPNVGKSTFVNRLVGRRFTIVEEHPGVTRDRKELTAQWGGREFLIVDTGGWLPESAASSEPAALSRLVSAQAERAIADADVIVLVTDVTVGVIEDDATIAKMLRQADKPAFVVVNKVDADQRESDAWKFTRLGLGDPFPVSALHGRGAGDVLDAVVTALPSADGPVAADDAPFSVAIVGRPNVGKSTLFNRIVGDERSVVHDAPARHVTRSTPSSIPLMGRCASSIRPGCDGVLVSTR